MDNKFRTMYHRKRVRAKSGSREKDLFRPQLDEHGHLELVPDGKEDLYAQIQSHRDSVDIHIMLERYQAGDASVLQRAQGTFADLTEFPKTYAEMLNSVIAGENYFNALPIETRAKFGHSFHKWMSAIGTEDFAEKMGFTEGNAKHEQPVAGSSELTPAVHQPTDPQTV